MQPDEALAFLKQGAAQIISEIELREKLALGRPPQYRPAKAEAVSRPGSPGHSHHR